MNWADAAQIVLGFSVVRKYSVRFVNIDDMFVWHSQLPYLRIDDISYGKEEIPISVCILKITIIARITIAFVVVVAVAVAVTAVCHCYC